MFQRETCAMSGVYRIFQENEPTLEDIKTIYTHFGHAIPEDINPLDYILGQCQESACEDGEWMLYVRRERLVMGDLLENDDWLKDDDI